MAVNIITDGLSGDIILPTTRDIVIKQITVTLTDEQIKALPSTDVVIVQSHGEGKIAVPIDISYITNLVAPYTNIPMPEAGSCGFYLAYDGYDIDSGIQTGIFGGTAYQGVQNFLEPLGGQLLKVQAIATAGVNLFNYANPWGVPIASSSNKAISTDCYNTLGDFTGGDPLNTIKITVAYVIIDL